MANQELVWAKTETNFAGVSIFCKNMKFFVNNSTFTQSYSARAVLEIL